ncbi:MAG: DNA polymerase III subunit beta [Lentisphaeria bacterium]|nr:DNA polymerase III subunit beta [Lentisphaeria bacterium]MBQ7395918.1 DNA polymerase III subunit beta [Lentisphaeria bacterium]
MKFVVDREKLQRALAHVSSIIGARSTLPLLGNVLIEAEDGKLTLTTTDLEMRMTTSIEADVETAGKTTLPARKLVSLVGTMTGTSVTVNVNAQDHAQVSCGTGRFRLLGLAASDFPAAAEFSVVREIKLKENDFKRMIGHVSYAACSDDSRKVLTGVLMSVRESNLTMVTTDGKRMAMQEIVPEEISGGDGDAIIAIRTMNEVRRLLEGDRVMTLRLGEKQCSFEIGSFVLTAKLIDGNYPNYRQVIPQSFNHVVEIPTAALLSKIEAVSLVLSENSLFIVMDFENNKLKLAASSAEVGDGNDEIDVEYSGDAFNVSFNPAFLADPLKATDAEIVKFKLNDSVNPVAIEAGEGFLYVIMPIRKK